MPASTLASPVSWFSAFQRVSPVEPLRLLLRQASDRLQPRRLAPHPLAVTTRTAAALALPSVGPQHVASILRERGQGGTPTIVLGGFVPDATEQVFLLRHSLRSHGDLYYVNYPRQGFSLDVLCAQLSDLADELARASQPPVALAVSFGGGVLLEWLRRAREAHDAPQLAGIVLVSPVACAEDLVAPEETKPSTLIGRALQPYLAATPPVAAQIEKSRTLFTKMFDAGAQNKSALRAVLTRTEAADLHQAVLGTIHSVDHRGARERVRALREMRAPAAWAGTGALPFTPAPALILYAEKEDAVLTPRSPTRRAFEAAHRAYFPASRCLVVRNPRGSPVPHASLVFHAANFRPPLMAFYRPLRNRKPRAAA